MHRPTAALVLVLTSLAGLAACADDDEDAAVASTSATAGSTDTVAPGETAPEETAFDGDAFDAACDLLTSGDSADPIAAMEAAVAELAAIGGEQAARNTLTIAVGERCPEWQDALDAVLDDAP